MERGKYMIHLCYHSSYMSCFLFFRIYDSVSSFFRSAAISFEHTLNLQLLKSLPVIHIIKAGSTIIPLVPPKDVTWEDNSLSLHIIRSNFPSNM